MTLRDSTFSCTAEPSADSEPLGELVLSEIIQQCSALPAAVASTEIAYVNERVLDATLLDFLTSESVQRDRDADWQRRKKRRQQALSPYLNKTLICVFLPLPGIHYTIEIDPELERVIHWEWEER